MKPSSSAPQELHTLIGVLCVAVCLLLPVNGATIYVDGTAGDDSNPGSVTQPLKSISAAIKASKLKDAIMVSGGVYSGDLNTGLSFEGVTLTTTENAIIDCNNAPGIRAVSLILTDATFTTAIAGFTIANCQANEAPAILISGQPAKVTLMDLNVYNNTALSNAGAVMWSFVSPTIIRCDFHHNRAGSAGALFAVSSPSFSITDSFVRDNTVTSDSGAMRVMTSQGTFTNVKFLRNYGNVRGGVGTIQMSVVTFTSCLFDSNWVSRDDSVFTIDTTEYTFNKCTFSNNNAVASGGIHASFASVTGKVSTFTGCTFSGNKADGKSAIYIKDDATCDIRDCTFSKNKAKSGADIYHDLGTLRIYRSTFKSTSGSACGVSILSNSVIQEASGLTMSDVTGSSAVCVKSGGMINMTSSTLVNCRGKDDGGALNVGEGVMYLRGVTVNNSYAPKRGGAIFVDEGTIYADNCQFYRNLANVAGGGIYFTPDSQPPTLSNLLFADNTPGALYWQMPATMSGYLPTPAVPAGMPPDSKLACAGCQYINTTDPDSVSPETGLPKAAQNGIFTGPSLMVFGSAHPPVTVRPAVLFTFSVRLLDVFGQQSALSGLKVSATISGEGAAISSFGDDGRLDTINNGAVDVSMSVVGTFGQTYSLNLSLLNQDASWGVADLSFPITIRACGLEDDRQIIVDYSWPGSQVYKACSDVHVVGASSAVFVVMLVLGVLGFIVVGFCVFCAVRYWSTPVFKSSSPLFLCVMLAGGFLAYMYVFLLGFDTETAGLSKSQLSGLCKVYPWLVGSAFLLMFLPILAKTYRIHHIFNNKTLNVNAMLVTNSSLLASVSVFLLLQWIIILVWQIADPLKARIDILNNHEIQYLCDSDHFTVFFSITCAFLVLVLFMGIFLAYEVRNVTSRFNESKLIVAAIYNLAIVCVIVVPVSLSINNTDVVVGIVGGGCWYGTTATLGLIFFGKVYVAVFRPDENRTTHGADSSVTTSLGSGKFDAALDDEQFEKVAALSSTVTESAKDRQIQRFRSAFHNLVHYLSSIKSGDAPSASTSPMRSPPLASGLSRPTSRNMGQSMSREQGEKEAPGSTTVPLGAAASPPANAV